MCIYYNITSVYTHMCIHTSYTYVQVIKYILLQVFMKEVVIVVDMSVILYEKHKSYLDGET